MAKRKAFSQINEENFKGIKKLQEAGLNQSEAMRATGRSSQTIANIYHADTLEDYKRLMRGNKLTKDDLVLPPMLNESIRQAKAKDAILLTTHAAFTGFDDMYDFVKEASDHEVTVTFAPMGKK